jgi:phosphohistidine phosphatase
MNLYILRHASAGTRRLNPLLDKRRPLDKEGKEHCLHLAQVLNALKVTFDLVASSPLKRSLQTAQLVATETGYEAQILLSRALSPEATFADFQGLLQEANGSENLLVVGHSPNIQMFLGSLLSEGASPQKIPQVRMRKGTIARLSINRGPGVRNPVTLTSVIDPRTVRALYATSTKSSRRKTSRK